jgi:hypothetical protein
MATATAALILFLDPVPLDGLAKRFVASPPGGMGLLQLVHVTSINGVALSVMMDVLGDVQ